VSWDRDVAAIAAQGLPTMLGPVRVPSPSRWRELLIMAEEQGLTGLLLRALDEGRIIPEDGALEGGHLGEAADIHLEAMAATLRLERMLVEAGTLLEADGIETRVLKGPAVAYLDHSEPALRSFRDIDLLVRAEDYDRVVELLERRQFVRAFPEPRPGFDRRFGRGVSLAGPAGWSIDLHRTLAFGPFGIRIDVADLWARSARFTVGGHTFSALGREERFLHACYHAALGDRRPRLVPVRDVAQLLLRGRLDLDHVRTLARHWSGEPVVALAVAEAWRVLGVAVRHPLAEWAWSYRPSRRAAAVRSLYRRQGSGYALISIAAVGALPSVRDRAAYLYALAVPNREYLAGRHGGVVQRFGHAARELGTVAVRRDRTGDAERPPPRIHPTDTGANR
jgi:hypothetical protein